MQGRYNQDRTSSSSAVRMAPDNLKSLNPKPYILKGASPSDAHRSLDIQILGIRNSMCGTFRALRVPRCSTAFVANFTVALPVQ